jgi:hypothetical protein
MIVGGPKEAIDRLVELLTEIDAENMRVDPKYRAKRTQLEAEYDAVFNHPEEEED